jgi:hypothetical protein
MNAGITHSSSSSPSPQCGEKQMLAHLIHEPVRVVLMGGDEAVGLA